MPQLHFKLSHDSNFEVLTEIIAKSGVFCPKNHKIFPIALIIIKILEACSKGPDSVQLGKQTELKVFFLGKIKALSFEKNQEFEKN